MPLLIYIFKVSVLVTWFYAYRKSIPQDAPKLESKSNGLLSHVVMVGC